MFQICRLWTKRTDFFSMFNFGIYRISFITIGYPPLKKILLEQFSPIFSKIWSKSVKTFKQFPHLKMSKNLLFSIQSGFSLFMRAPEFLQVNTFQKVTCVYTFIRKILHKSDILKIINLYPAQLRVKTALFFLHCGAFTQ